MAKTKGKFKVEIRKTCKICGGPLPSVRHRTFCSPNCRNKYYYRKYRERYGDEHYNRRQREYLYKKFKDDGKEKIQCRICGKWFRQVGSHVYWTHKMTARDYREFYSFDVKRGQLPEDLRQLKAEQVFENGTVKNLKAGRQFWFKKGQEGVGVYKRSAETMERLKHLSSYQKSKK